MVEEQKPAAPLPTYTEEEVNYREDLLEKLMTLEHVRSILAVRDEAPVYINQINSLQRLVQGWYNKAVEAKAPKPAEAPAAAPATEEETD